MSHQRQFVLGLGMVGLGVLLLLGVLLQINLWAICWPTALIGLGVWLVVGPRLRPAAGTPNVVVLGDARRSGPWTASDEEFWVGVADLDLDMTEAELPPGETRLKVYGFVGDVSIIAPHTVGIKVDAAGFVVECDFWGRKHERFFAPLELASDGYEMAEHRLVLEMVSFVAEMKIRRF